jgi:S-adenosylmethionine:tRNA ribosyltransferase-isomerase
MSPAQHRRAAPEVRLLDVGTLQEVRLEQTLRAGDLMIVNDSAVLPASLAARTRTGTPFELRLLRPVSRSPEHRSRLTVVALGEGAHATRTEDRAPPPELAVGKAVFIGKNELRLVEREPKLARVWHLETSDHASLWSIVYEHGRPIQYSHVPNLQHWWDIETPFAGEPWSVEAPSASFILDHARIQGLREQGVGIATVTHAAGLSSSGDAELDAMLPLVERSRIPDGLAARIEATRSRGGRVIGVGTTVVRTLEGAMQQYGDLAARTFENALRLSRHTRLRVVDAIVTGVHEQGTSHFELLQAFAAEQSLHKPWRRASASGF